MLLIKIEDARGNLLDAFTIEEKSFKTGSRGFQGNKKVKVGELRYQTQVQMVEIGSKPTGEGAEKEEAEDTSTDE